MVKRINESVDKYITFDMFEKILRKHNVYIVEIEPNGNYKSYVVEIPFNSYKDLARELDKYSNVEDSELWVENTYFNDYYSNGSYRDTTYTTINVENVYRKGE